MTTRIRASVYLNPWSWATPLTRWFIQIDSDRTIGLMTATEPSWPEAMQRAYKLLADADAALMDEIYESRATRREQVKS